MKENQTVIILLAGISLATSSVCAQSTSGTSPTITAPVPTGASTSTIPATTGTTIVPTPGTGGGTTTPAIPATPAKPTGPVQPLGPIQPDLDGILRDQAGTINALRNIDPNLNQGNQPNSNAILQQVNPTPGLGSDKMRKIGVGNIELTPANRPAGTTIQYIKKTVRRPVAMQTSPEGVGNSGSEDEDNSKDQKEKDYQFDLRESLSDSTVMDLLSSDTSEVSPTDKLENELAKESEPRDIFNIGPGKAAGGLLVSFSGDTPASFGLEAGFSAAPIYSDQRKQDDEELADGDGKQADGSNPDGTYPDGTYGYNDTTIYFIDDPKHGLVKYNIKVRYVSKAAWNETVLKGKIDVYLKVEKEDLLANSQSDAQLKADLYNWQLYREDQHLSDSDAQIRVYLVTDGDPLVKGNREKANRYLERTLGKSHRKWHHQGGQNQAVLELNELRNSQYYENGMKHNNSSIESGSDPDDHNDERGQNLGNPGRLGGGNAEPDMRTELDGPAETGNQQSTSGNAASAATDTSSSAGEDGSTGTSESGNEGGNNNDSNNNGDEDDEKDNNNSEEEEDPNLVARGALGGEERDEEKGPSWAIDSLHIGSKVANGGQTNGVGGTIRFGDNGSEKPGQGPLNEKGITPSNSGFPTIRFDPDRIDEGAGNLSLLESKLYDPTIRLGSEDGGDPNGTPKDGPIGSGTGGPVIDPNGAVTRDMEKIEAESEFTNELDLDLESLDFNGSFRNLFD